MTQGQFAPTPVTATYISTKRIEERHSDYLVYSDATQGFENINKQNKNVIKY
jgi:hypothetical protein